LSLFGTARKAGGWTLAGLFVAAALWHETDATIHALRTAAGAAGHGIEAGWHKGAQIVHDLLK
jgi:hypothetical protein